MAALAFCGVAVGPNMLTTNVDLSYVLAATVILANLLAVPYFFMVIPSLVRLSALRMDAIAPLAIAASVTGALIAEPTLMTIVQIFAAATLGVALKVAEWPRAPFVLGFVVEQMAENAAFQTAAIWGWSALRRPITVALLIFIIGWVVVSLRKHPPLALTGDKRTTLMVSIGLTAFFVVTILFSLSLSVQSAVAPIAISAVSLVFCLIIAVAAPRARDSAVASERMQYLGLTALFIVLTPIIGLPVATIAYVGAILKSAGLRAWHAVAIVVALLAAQIGLLSLVFDLRIEKAIIGRVLWALLGQ